MKKSLIAFAVAAVSCTASFAAEQVVVTQFQGEVISGGCQVKVAGPNNVVNLGTVDVTSAQSTVEGSVFPVTFGFNGTCAAQLDKIEVAGVQNGGLAGWNAGDKTIATDKDKVKVQLVDLNGGQLTGDGTVNNDKAMNGQKTYFGAKLVAEQGATPGIAKAVVNFKFTWQ